MRRFTLPLFLLTILLCSCTRSFQVYDAKQLKNRNRDYLFYALPRTVIGVDIPVTRIARDPIDPQDPPQCVGDAAARRELGLSAPPEVPERLYRAGAPAISTRAEPDSEAIYAVDLRFRPFALTTGSFEMTENGVLTTQSVSQEDKSIDAILSVAKLAASVATGLPVAPASASSASTAAIPGCEQAKKDILQIRAARTKLLTDSIVREGATKEYTEFVLGQLDKLEDALVAKFSGPTSQRVATVHCDLRPTQFDAERPSSLFRLSAKKGIWEIASACQVPAILRAPAGTSDGDGVFVRVAADGPMQYATALRPLVRPASADPRGFFYRVPAAAVVTVEIGDDVKTRQLANVAQLGTFSSLPVVGGAFVRKAGMSPTLNASGGLQKLTLNSEPSGQEAVSSLVGLAGTIHDAGLAKKEADAKARDELALLERKRSILEEQKKIAELEQALAQLRGGQ